MKLEMLIGTIAAVSLSSSLSGQVCDPASTGISESTDDATITVGGSVACEISGGVSGHVYGRSHDLSLHGLGDNLELTCVHWALESAPAGIAFDVEVFLDTDGNRTPLSSAGDLSSLGSLSVTAGSTPGFVTAEFNPPLAVSSSDLIFVTLSHASNADTIYVGANNAGQASPSWLRTTGNECNIGNWIDTSGIGFDSVHWVERIEVRSAATPDPCDEPLPACPADLSGPDGSPDQTVGVDDLLFCIGGFGATGDGTFRPDGDIYPLPNGDCGVDVDDLLAVISAFGETCEAPTGACCVNGGCDELSNAECDALGGAYQGDGSDCAACIPDSDVRINEARLNQPGADDDEYFELSGTPGSDLSGLTYLVIGDSSAGGFGVIEEAVSLDGYSMNAGGLFLCGEPTMTLATPDLAYELNFESSDQTTHMLVSGFTGMNNDDLDTDDDGTLDITPWSAVLDSVAFIYEDAVGDPIYSDNVCGPDGLYTPGHGYVCDGAWYVGTFELSVLDTPGAPNNCDTEDSDGDGVFDSVDNCPDLANPDQSDCDGDGYGDACAIADGLSADCNENGTPDECEGDCNGNGAPDDCDVADGTSNDCDGNGTPDECDPDCNGNGIPDVCDIADGNSEDADGNGVPDECEGPVFVINEIGADPDSTLGDANGDGVANYSDDEFFEVVNLTGADIDMSGWIMSDATADRHVFPFGTIVGDGCAVVVFGGGEPTGDFGGAIVMTASNGSMGLNNGGDTITIRDAEGTIQLEETYGSAGNNQSITRNPDAYGTTWVDHSTVAPDGALFSPGTRIDGVSFGGDCGGGKLPDSDDDGVPDQYDNCELPNPDQADCNDNGVGDVCDIADGTSSDDNANGIPDECEETVSGGWINEFHYDNGGGDLNEFVEIVLLDGVDIASVEISFYNGSNGTVYASYTGAEMQAGETGTGYAIYSILHSGIQNGAPDGFCLTIDGSVAQFISYEGSLTATAGPAAGLTSEDVGVAESGGTNENSSLGLTGTGGDSTSMTWTVLTDLANPGFSNDGQSITP